MPETILAIDEQHDRRMPSGDPYYGGTQDGFVIATDKQEIWLGIDNGQSCCENWGYLLSEDDPSKFIGAELRAIVKTDTNRTSKVITHEGYWERTQADKDNTEYIVLDDGEVMFIDLATDRGVLQFVAYNAHNGYYGHDVTVQSRQLSINETL